MVTHVNVYYYYWQMRLKYYVSFAMNSNVKALEIGVRVQGMWTRGGREENDTREREVFFPSFLAIVAYRKRR